MAEFLDANIADWDEDLKEKAAPLACWTHVACTRLVAKDESKGSALKSECRLFSNYTSESFEWVSGHLEKITGYKLPKLMPKEGFSNPNVQNSKQSVEKPIKPDYASRVELIQILKNQTTILQILAQRSTSSGLPSATVASTQRAIGALTEN